jgi:hypothetical protein
VTKLKDVDPNSPTGRRVIADLKGKLDTNDRNEAISFGKKYGIFKDVPVKPAFKKDGGLMEAIEKVKKEDAVKMKRGGMARARAPRKMGFLDEAVDEFIETMEPFQGTVKKGETLRNIDGKTMVVTRTPNPNFRGNRVSDADREMMLRMLGARKMENGGKVPPKFKGFSKLPEDVQEQMNPTLAKKFEKGGVVKMGKGGGVCKGMGIARAGGKFKLR